MPHALAFNSSQSITASGTGERLETYEAPVRGIEFSFLHLSFFNMLSAVATDRQIDRHIDRHTDRLIDEQTDRLIDRQTDR